MKSKQHPSQERLRELFEYRDHESQPFIWKISLSNRVKIGDVAGCSTSVSGYCQVGIDDTYLRIHRLVWIYHNGDIPDKMFVDHIDGDKLNNRIENLRLATRSQNQHNCKKQSNNTSGVKGIGWNKQRKKWRARITINGKSIWLGYYNTIEEAEAAITAARNNLHGEFARHE
jgi:hypothetical protein